MKNIKSQKLQTDKSERKERIKAKIRAKVKFKVEKQLLQHGETLKSVIERLENLRGEISILNPRMTPLQLHTKNKWVDELLTLENLLTLLVGKPESKEESVQVNV